MIDLDSSCHCDDPRWEFTVSVAGKVVDRSIIDCSAPDVEALARETQRKQLRLTEIADAAGQDWKLELSCPACGAGDMLTNAKRILHVLAVHDGRNEPKIEATCGHVCMASPPTISLLANVDHSHVVVCLPCYTGHEAEWMSQEGLPDDISG